MRGCILEVSIPVDYHFVDPDLGLEVFLEKEGETEKGNDAFKLEDWGTSGHLYWG